MPVRSLLRFPLLALLGALMSGCALTASPAEGTPRSHESHDEHAARAIVAPAASVEFDGYSLYELPAEWRTAAGDTVRLSSLAGRVQVVAMVYTSCTATCPMILADLKRIEASVPADRRGDVGFTLVSLDPWRDTPGRLAEWARGAGLDPARWTLLSGDDDAVRELAASLEVRYQAQGGGEIAHTNALTVLDRDGTMRHRQVGLGSTDATLRAVQSLLR